MTDPQTRELSIVVSETDDINSVSDPKLKQASPNRFEAEKDGTSCYYAEDDNSVNSDTLSSHGNQRDIPPFSSINEEKRSSVNRERKFKTIYNNRRLKVEQGPCTKCGTVINLPQYLKTSLTSGVRPSDDIEIAEVSDNLICVPCMIKETGHAECLLPNCSTCREFAERANNIDYCRKKLNYIQEKQSLTNYLTMKEHTNVASNDKGCHFGQGAFSSEQKMTGSTEIEGCSNYFSVNAASNQYSFEELRYYDSIRPRELVQIPVYSTSSYRHAEELGYDTDSSLGQSSVSSGGSQCSYSELITARKRNMCKICKTSLNFKSKVPYGRKISIPICNTCAQGHRNCEQENCQACIKMARLLDMSLKYQRKKHLLRKKGNNFG